MITIINKYTGEVITKYSGALVGESTEDSFIANAKGKAVHSFCCINPTSV